MTETPNFAVIDLEATSREPAEAHIVEWAAVLIVPEFFERGGRFESSGLVRPPVAIPPETSAVHHIIDSDVADAPTWDVAGAELYHCLAGAIAVAHNAEYERTVLARYADTPADIRWICTYKAALRLWPESPSHSNESLRYFLGHGTGRRGAQAPHSALHDARVTALILTEALKLATVEDLLKWTEEPALLPRCPIGKFRNMPWPEVDHGFLEWILYKAADMREDIKFCARKEIDRRQEEWQRKQNAARLATAGNQTAAAAEDEDVPL